METEHEKIVFDRTKKVATYNGGRFVLGPKIDNSESPYLCSKCHLFGVCKNNDMKSDDGYEGTQQVRECMSLCDFENRVWLLDCTVSGGKSEDKDGIEKRLTVIESQLFKIHSALHTASFLVREEEKAEVPVPMPKLPEAPLRCPVCGEYPVVRRLDGDATSECWEVVCKNIDCLSIKSWGGHRSPQYATEQWNNIIRRHR